MEEEDNDYASIFDEIESYQHPPVIFEFQQSNILYNEIREPIIYDLKAECIPEKIDLLETYRFVLTNKALYRFPLSSLNITDAYIRLRNPRIRVVRELLSIEGSTKTRKAKDGIQLIGFKGTICIFINKIDVLFDFYQVLKKFCVQYNISKKYLQENEIGKGHFSIVYVASSKTEKKRYAIKTIKKSNLTKNKEAMFLLKNEIDALRITNHKNIVKLYEIYEGTKKVYLILEYLKGGELLSYINSSDHYSEEIAQKIMKYLLAALSYCHELGIVHRDIKPENLIFINTKDEDFNLKIIDFGISAILTNEKCLTQKYGTAGYIAPEILEGYSTTCKSDIFSAGVILHILLTGIFPFNDSTTKKITEKK